MWTNQKTKVGSFLCLYELMELRLPVPLQGSVGDLRDNDMMELKAVSQESHL